MYSIYITLWALFHVLSLSNGNNMKTNGIVKVYEIVLQNQTATYSVLSKTTTQQVRKYEINEIICRYYDGFEPFLICYSHK